MLQAGKLNLRKWVNSSERRELIDSGFSKEAGRGGAGPSQDTSLTGQVCMPPQSRDQEGRKMRTVLGGLSGV